MGVTLSSKSRNDWSNVDCSVEVGIPIRITHRIIVKSKDLISPYHCVIQYKSGLENQAIRKDAR